MTDRSFGGAIRAHIEWQFANDPGFKKAWTTYMRENAVIRGYPRWYGLDGAWTPTQYDRLHPAGGEECDP